MWLRLFCLLMAQSNPIVLFDGVCNMCSTAVRWIIARDKRAVFRFASLQSEAGRSALAAAGAPKDLPDSVILIQDGRVLSCSDAAIGIGALLGFPWSLARIGLVLPRFVRDGAYRWVARNRYRWFGKQETCMVPTAALRGRFLDGKRPPE